MKQYQVQMKLDGKWVMGRYPTGQGWRTANPPTTREKAEKGIEELKDGWVRYNYMRHTPPTDYRIVSRIVTDWEVEE
jgi:hypothetical protein